MNKSEAKKRIEKLKAEINYHRYLYHVLDKQEISDAALDSLKHELEILERQFPEYISSDSPTQRVGGKPLEKFKKVTHQIRMVSLNDAFTEEEMSDWEERIKKIFPTHKFEYFAEVKLDGFAVALEYEKGVLKTGSTRGDGLVGEDVTQNLKTIESIPLRLRQDIDAEIRGEVIMTKKSFEAANARQKQLGEKIYANPRNLAAGSIRQLDPRLAASRNLDFMAYELTGGIKTAAHKQEHEVLKELGFKTIDLTKFCRNLREVFQFYKSIAEKRNSLPYQIDGVVVSVNDNTLKQKLGIVGKAPRGVIAYKFPAEQATTIVEDISVQVGRTGALTPVATLNPVPVAGTVVSRATLHNMDEVKRLGVKIGDTVIIQKAGDIIPEIVSVLPKLRTGQEKDFVMPKNCPICGSLVLKKPGEVAYYCSNKNCFSIEKEKIIHFVSKKAFNIVGLGEKIVEQLINAGLIKNAADIFKLKEGDLEVLERFAAKSARNLVLSINNAKKITLSKFIYSLGIRHVGEETALVLAKEFGNIRDLMKAKKEILENLPDVGPIVALSIYNWFSEEENKNFVKQLLASGIELEKPAVKRETPLAGKIFVLSGSLNSMSREDAKEKIRQLGGDVSSSVSKNTDYLVLGIKPGSKLDRAKKLGVKILAETEFIKLVSK